MSKTALEYAEQCLGLGVPKSALTDTLAIFQDVPALRDQLMGLAEKKNIPYQREVLAFGGTDAGSMQTSRGGIPVCTLSIPCRYVHSALEPVDLRDMEAGVQLMLAYMEDGVK